LDEISGATPPVALSLFPVLEPEGEVYLEDGQPPRYLFQDEWRDCQVIEEPIRIKGQKEPFIEKVLKTHHGPLVSDLVGYPAQRVAVQSMALRPVQALEGWYRLNTASHWDEFVLAMRLIEAPQLNVVYADVEDNIGYWVTGKVPRRAQGDGRVPVLGWTGEYEWTGEVPFERMPHALNPQGGVIINCNNKIVDDDFPYFLGDDYMNGYRARRLQGLFEAHPTLSMGDHLAFQMDLVCLPGLELVSRLEGFTTDDEDVALALKLLSKWDGVLAVDSVGGTVFEVARYRMVRDLLEPGLGEELARRVMGEGFHPLLAPSNEFYGHDTVTLLRLLDSPDSWWVQEAGGRDALIESSLKETIAWLRATIGPDVM